MPHDFNASYTGQNLDRVAIPMGGIGAGMIALEGGGKLGQLSIRNGPSVFNEPYIYAAAAVRHGDVPFVARLLEGPVPAWKITHPWGTWHDDSATGGRGRTYGLPRFADAEFTPRFPFADVALTDPTFPLRATVTGWSPFVPRDTDVSSLPVAAVEYVLTNASKLALDGVFSFHARNFMGADPRHTDHKHPGYTRPIVDRTGRGFTFHAAGFDDAHEAEGHFAAEVDPPSGSRVAVDAAWFRGGWFDAHSVLWKNIAEGRVIDQPPHASGLPGEGGSLYVPFSLAPGETRTFRVRLAWYVPQTSLGSGPRAKGTPLSTCDDTHAPWYAGRFDSLAAVNDYWRSHCDELRRRSRRFAEAFHAMTLPPEAIEAVAANIAILKTPTVLRQRDGRLWAWEGCFDAAGCCSGTCTHVWNYAQALPHLFPSLERTLRETEFEVAQAHDGDTAGHQAFRVCLPISEPKHDYHAAADGQLGGIVKLYRDWRICGDTAWLRRLWPRVKESLAFCIRTWDPDHTGVPHKPHHNTYDIEFWGPNGMIGSFYVAALQAAVAMGEALGDVDPLWPTLLQRGRDKLERDLFNGEYFIQKVDPTAGHHDPTKATPEAAALFEQEGLKYQYGDGCLSDGVLGAWMAATAGLPPVLDPAKVESHLAAVFRHNFKSSLAEHANPQRPAYAVGNEAGLLLCSWPRGNKLTLPFVYSDEVWTGIEYQVASHLILAGRAEEGLAIVRAARQRYDGATRNPFDEFECGHWYARAMASYTLLQALTGLRYDAADRTLHVDPKIPTPFTSFLSTDRGYATVRVTDDDVQLDVIEGDIPIARILRP